MRNLLKNISILVLTVICPYQLFAQNTSSHWTCDDHTFQYEMAVYFRIIIDGETISDYGNYEIAAFCGTECRGVSEVVALGDTSIGYIRIRSNQIKDETISFKAFDKTNSKEFETDESISFKSEELLGMPSTPKELHITATPITITAQNVERVYGDKNPELKYTVEGVALSGTPLLSCEATETSSVGTYPVVATIGTITNKNVTLVNGMLTIARAQLTISVGEYTREQGEDNPNFTITYNGFKNGENQSVLTTQPTAYCNATKDSAPGEYAITLSGASATNYEISYNIGKLIVKGNNPQPSLFKDEDGEIVKGYLVTENGGGSNAVITEISEGMLNGETPIPSEVVGEDGAVYKVNVIVAEAFENLSDETIIILPMGMRTDKPVVNVINGDGTCETLDLTNVENFEVPQQLTIAKVIYKHDISSGTSTICLPYDIDVPTGGVLFYTLNSGIGGNAGFKKYTEAKLKAYMPYVMKTAIIMARGGTRAGDDGGLTIDFSSNNVVINPITEDQYVEKDDLEMFGTVHGLTNKQGIEKQALILHSDGTWKMSASQTSSDSEKQYIPPFRAYMVKKNGIYENIGSVFDDPTSIRNIVISKDEIWYNINGIKLNGKPSKPGLYIKNGEKVIY